MLHVCSSMRLVAQVVSQCLRIADEHAGLCPEREDEAERRGELWTRHTASIDGSLAEKSS